MKENFLNNRTKQELFKISKALNLNNSSKASKATFINKLQEVSYKTLVNTYKEIDNG